MTHGKHDTIDVEDGMGASMNLETEDGKELSHPSATQVEDALRSMSDMNSFAILSSGEETYLQAFGCPASGFIVEYRDGSEESHFQSASDAIPLGTVVEMFQRYASNDPGWRPQVSWKPWRRATSRSPVQVVLGAGIIVLAFTLVFLLVR